jgi:hypothetical protein
LDAVELRDPEHFGEARLDVGHQLFAALVVFDGFLDKSSQSRQYAVLKTFAEPESHNPRLT